MAAVDKKISQLTTLVDATSNDFFVVVDRSEPNVDIRTKKIILADLMGNPGPIGLREPNYISTIQVTAYDNYDDAPTLYLPAYIFRENTLGSYESYINQGGGNLNIVNSNNGGDVTAYGKTSSGQDVYMIGADPNDGVFLFEEGKLTFSTYRNTSLSSDTGLTVWNNNDIYDGTSYVGHLTIDDTTLYLWAGVSNHIIEIGGYDTTGVYSVIARFDPNDGTRLYAGGDQVFRAQDDQVTITGNADVTGDVHIYGDAVIDGTTFVINTAVIVAEDPIITVNNGETGAGVTSGEAGLLVDRGTVQNYKIIFDETDDRFKVGLVGAEKLVLTGQAGNDALSLGDSTSIVVFATAEDDANYSVTWSLVYEGGGTPSIYSGTVFDKLTTGFSVIFSGPMDTNDYVLSWIITR